MPRWTGEDCRRARVEAGLLQRDVAAGSGLPRWKISHLEKQGDGTFPTPSEERRIKLAISYLGDLERKRRQFIHKNRPEVRPRKRTAPLDDPEEVEAEPVGT